MKIFIGIWITIQSLLLFGGGVWSWIVWKDKEKRKLPLCLFAAGCFMMSIFFLVLKPIMQKS